MTNAPVPTVGFCFYVDLAIPGKKRKTSPVHFAENSHWYTDTKNFVFQPFPAFVVET